MDNPNDPLRNGAIFKLKAGALRSPPKIVQFEAPKGSASKTPAKMPTVSNVNSDVRTAFDHIYRQTPTPKILLGRTAQERTSSVNSPYWTSSLADQLPHVPLPITPFQTPIVAHITTPVMSEPSTVASILSTPVPIVQPEPVEPVQDVMPAEPEVTSTQEVALESDTEPEPIIKPVKRNTDMSALKSPNLAKKARIEKPTASSLAAPTASVIPARSSSANAANTSNARTDASSKSRTGSRGRTGGADSLLLLVSGAAAASHAAPSSSAASSRPSGASSSTASSSSGVTAQRSSSTAGRGTSRTQTSGPSVVVSALVSSAASRAPGGLKERPAAVPEPSNTTAPELTNTKSKAPTPTAAPCTVESSPAVTATKPKRTTRRSLAPTPAPESDSEPHVEVVSKLAGAATRRVSTGRAAKRKIGSEGESEHSESEVFPATKSRPAPKRSSRGRNKPAEGQSSDEDEGKAEKEEEQNEGEEVTVTRSGRKSIPKRVIPLAEDAMQSEKQQLKANRARRVSSVPVPAPKPAPEPARATSRSRKSVGSATNTAAASDKGTKAARAAKSSVWSGSERQALYKVQGEVDISAPNFWEQVSEGLADVGLERTADECQLQWFATVAEAAVRKKNKDEKTREQNAANAVSAATTTQATSSSSRNGEEEPPAKAKRLGKGALKKLAQESSKATRDDDIFDSEAMRSYWNEEPVINDELLEDLQLFDPTYHAAAAATSSSALIDSANGANKRKSITGEESEHELEFGGSHVHKLNYRPPSKLYAGAQASKAETTTKSAPNKLVNAKTGKVNSTLIAKQVNAAVQGARKTARGGKGAARSDSSDEESSDLDSEDDDEDM